MRLFKQTQIKKSGKASVRELSAAELNIISGGAEPGEQVCVVRDNLIVKCPAR